MSKEDSLQDMSRRKFLAAATAVTVPGISGCGGNDSDSNGTSAQSAETPSNAGTDTPGNNNQRNAPTDQGQDQDSTNGRNVKDQNQNSKGEEIDIPHWEDANDLYETQKLIYKGVDKLSDQCAFTVDPDYIDGSELEPTKYEGDPTTEHKIKKILNGEYRGEMEELTVVVLYPDDEGPGSTGLHLYGNSGRIDNDAGSDPSREAQVDAFEHIDGEGVLHSSEDLPEYVEQVLTGQ